MPSAEIVSIGSELLLGQIVDTNGAWMAQRLTNVGVDLYYKTTVGDNPGRMKGVIGRALDRSDIVITGGGLGPTRDDLTGETIAAVTGRELVLDRDLLDQIERRFQRRGLIMTANNSRQAYIPDGAIPGRESERHRAVLHRGGPQGRGHCAAWGAVRDEVAVRQRGHPVPARHVRSSTR